MQKVHQKSTSIVMASLRKNDRTGLSLMRARILMDEPIYGPPTGTTLMKKVTVELHADGWSKTVSITVPADLET